MTSLKKNVSEKIAIVMLVKNTTTLVSTAIKQLCKQSYSNWELFVICDENIGYVKEYEELKSIITTKNINFEKIKTNHQYGYINHVLQTLNDEFSYFTIINSCDLFYPNYLKFMLNENKQFVYGNYHIKNNSTKQSKKYQDINDFIQNYHSLCFTLWSTKIINHLGELNLNTSDPLFDYFIRTFLSLDVSEYCYIHRALGTCFCEHKNRSFKKTQQQISVYKELLKDKDINDMLKCSLLMNEIPCDYHPLIIMPTYNRANNIEERINMIIHQTYDQWTFVIIDDGSTSENKAIFNNIKDKYAADKRIIFLENEINSKVAYTLNKGLQYFLENEHLSHLTWISDDNVYYNNYLFHLFAHNKDFVYSAYDILNTEDNSTSINYWKMIDFESLLVRFDGCASFMWSRNAIKKIGCYNEEIPGCEDYEYLLRTYKVLDIEDICFVDKTLMTFVRHPNQGTEKERDRIFTLKNEITKKFNSRIQQKVSIVMAYYNRKPQTLETLKGFQKMYAGKYNFEVIIVDDNSNEENRLEEDIKQFTFPINLIVISAEEKGDRINPCIAYNRGFTEATGDIIVIQNPECYHVGDILKHTLENLGEQDYFTYSCFSVNSEEITNQIINSEYPLSLINNNFSIDNRNINWYNHPDKRCSNSHFCSAIHKYNLNIIGGFDEQFQYGFCFDNDELLHKITHNLKLNVKCIDTNNCLVIRQCYQPKISVNIHINNLLKFKWDNNANLLQVYNNGKNFNYPKIFHSYWDGSSMSYLTYLTYVSFLKYHPDWSVVVHIPKQRIEKITWFTPEQKDKYTGTNYFDKLLDNHRIVKNYVDFEKIGFYNNISEVIKSDYLRYYMLYKYGGVWSDNDIIYTSSLEDKLNYNNENILFKCSYTKGSYYYPIGFFCCKRNSSFFKYLIKYSKIYYNKDHYQCIGATMINDLIDKNKIDIRNSIFLDNTYYLPFHFNQLDKIFKLKNSNLHNNTFGVHWFNGAKESKIYQNNLSDRIHNFEDTCFIDQLINEYIKNREYCINYYSNYYTIPSEINEIKYSDKWLLEKIPKRLFVYWGGEKLPWLRYMTIESFIKFNPDWEIIFIIPKTLSNILTWDGKQPERNSLCYKDYMPKIYELEKENKVKVEIFDFETIGLDNNYNEVHKSDFLRYYLLYSRGGVWSDMDILYYDSINYISVNNSEYKDKEIFVKYKELNSKEIGIEGHAIGFFMGSPNNLFFKEIFNLAKEKYNPNGYQIIGPDLLNEYYPVNNELKNNYNLECITKADIYSLDHNTPSLFENFEDNPFDNYYTENSVGIHWYGGHVDFKNVLMSINEDNFIEYPNNGFVVKKLREII